MIVLSQEEFQGVHVDGVNICTADEHQISVNAYFVGKHENNATKSLTLVPFDDGGVCARKRRQP